MIRGRIAFLPGVIRRTGCAAPLRVSERTAAAGEDPVALRPVFEAHGASVGRLQSEDLHVGRGVLPGQTGRGQGQSHACALRCLAQRWLKILWKMWQTHTLYDPELHARNQQRHGSWVLQLNPKKT